MRRIGGTRLHGAKLPHSEAPPPRANSLLTEENRTRRVELHEKSDEEHEGPCHEEPDGRPYQIYGPFDHQLPSLEGRRGLLDQLLFAAHHETRQFSCDIELSADGMS